MFLGAAVCAVVAGLLALVLFRTAATRGPRRGHPAPLRRLTTTLGPVGDEFDDLLAANAAYAAHFEEGDFDGIAHAGVAIVTCMDSRIDPLRMLGLQHGDAKIFRNPGGRVTPQALEALVLGVHLLNVDRILVIPHTRCAMTASTQEELRDADRRVRRPGRHLAAVRRRRGPDGGPRRGRRQIRTHPLIPRPSRSVASCTTSTPAARAQGLAGRSGSRTLVPMRLLERELQLGALHDYAADARRGRRPAGAGLRRGRDRQVHPGRGVRRGSRTPRRLERLRRRVHAVGPRAAAGRRRPVGRRRPGRVRRRRTSRRPLRRPALDAARARRPVGAGLEDLHFADEATLDLVGHLARRLRGVRALVVATYRDDGLAENRALRETLGEASSQRSTRRIALPPLTPAASTRSATAPAPAGRGARAHRRQPVLRHRGAARRATSSRPLPATPSWPGPPGSPRRPRGARRGGPGRRARRARPAGRGHRRRPCALDEPVARDCWSPTDGPAVPSRDRPPRRRARGRPAPRRRGAPPDPRRARGGGRRDDARLAHHAEGALDAAATVRYARRAGDRSAALASRREAAAQYHRALRFVPADQPLVRADLLDELGIQLATLDQFGPAADALEESVTLWRAEGVPLREGDALRRLSVAYYRLCRGPEERAALAAGTRRARAAGPVPRAGLGAVADGRPVHGRQRDRRGAPTTPRAPARWPRPSASPTCQRRPQHAGLRRVRPGERWLAWLREALDTRRSSTGCTTRPGAPTPTCRPC